MSLEQNKQDREDAEELVALCGDREPRFWECLERLAAERARPPAPPVAEEPEERLLARVKRAGFPRGSYAMLSPLEAPPSYVAWWLDATRDEFTKLLERYVKTAEFRRRREAEEAQLGDKPPWLDD